MQQHLHQRSSSVGHEKTTKHTQQQQGPFSSALLELSSNSRRWKFEASKVLNHEIGLLEELQAAAVEDTRRAVAQAEERVRRECELEIAASEARGALEIVMLGQALRDAEGRAAYYEQALAATLSTVDRMGPPPAW